MNFPNKISVIKIFILTILLIKAEYDFDVRNIPYRCDENNIESQKIKQKGAATISSLWPNGVVYYEFSSEYNAEQIKELENGFRMIEDGTRVNGMDCISFRKRKNQKDYVKIVNGNGCSSYVGMRGGEQNITISKNGCVHRSVAAHEAIHALGLDHEHNRPDRDKYINVYIQNAEPNYAFAFSKINGFVNLYTPYDRKSIMHYQSYAFSKNPFSSNQSERYTILSKYEPYVIDYNYNLTSIDIKEIQILYGCLAETKTSFGSIRSTLKTTLSQKNHKILSMGTKTNTFPKISIFLPIKSCADNSIGCTHWPHIVSRTNYKKT